MVEKVHKININTPFGNIFRYFIQYHSLIFVILKVNSTQISKDNIISELNHIKNGIFSIIHNLELKI